MEISLDSIASIIGLFLTGGGGAFFTWKWLNRRARAEAMEKEAEAKSAEVDMAKKVQDTYQEMLEDKQKEVVDNQRLIAELREDRDHYKQGYLEFRDQIDKLSKEFRDFRNETEEERMTMKRDIARNGRMMECMRPLLCGREGCAIRVPVTISATGVIEQTVKEIEPYDDKNDS
jgi:hypothetical protein